MSSIAHPNAFGSQWQLETSQGRANTNVTEANRNGHEVTLVTFCVALVTLVFASLGTSTRRLK